MTARTQYQPGLFDEPTACVASRTLDQATAEREAVLAALKQGRENTRKYDGIGVPGLRLEELSSDWQTDVSELRRQGHEIEMDVYEERFYLVRLK